MCPVCALQRSTILHFPELICQLLLQWQVDPLQYFINVPNYFNIFKGADLFHAKILFYICTGANGF